MAVVGIDHIAWPTSDAERLAQFYSSLGFNLNGIDEWRAGQSMVFSVGCGNQKINIHSEAMVALRGDPAYLRGDAAEPGCGDVCFVWDGGVEALLALLDSKGMAAIDGPVPRKGGRSGTVGISVYVRDPDGNLLEFISYVTEDVARYGHLGRAM